MSRRAGSRSLSTSWLEVCSHIGGDLERVESSIRQIIACDDRLMADVSGYLFDAGGKRLRPALALLTARFGGTMTAAPTTMAAAIEVLHTATLLHDDVVDDAALRRHRPSANARWSNSMAVLAGGYLFSKAMQTFGSVGDAINQAVCDTVERIWRGQTLETQHAHNLDLDETTYFEIIESKTAALYDLACRVGSITVGLSQCEVDALGGYGMDLGIAFQLVDDVLDVVADEDTLGKPPAADMRGGVYTLPVIYTLGREIAGAGRLRTILAQRHPSQGNLEEALDILQHNGSVSYALEAAMAMLRRARERLGALADGDAKDALHRLSRYVLMRPEIAFALSQHADVISEAR
jgi:geranylgeranyl pyrophosphate synthase